MEHQSAVGSVAFSPDGKTILTGSYDTTARLWDAPSQVTRGPSGQLEGRVLAKHEGGVSSVAFSPDGKIIATASSDGVLQFWDASTLSPFGKPLVHESSVWSASFGPDGKTILTVWGPRTPRHLERPALGHRNRATSWGSDWRKNRDRGSARAPTARPS